MRCIAIPSIPSDPLPDSFLMVDLLFKKGMKEFKSDKVLKWLSKNSYM